MISGFIDLAIASAGLFIAYYLMALGHSIVEKSGVLNLAIDGLYALSATLAFFFDVYYSNNLLLSFTVPALVAIVFGLFMAFVLTKFPVSHGAVGLSLMFLMYGLASIIGYGPRIVQAALPNFSPGITLTQNERIIGYIIMVALGAFFYWFIEGTKIGVSIKASGEDPAAAESLGTNVLLSRLIAAGIGFAMMGLGGAAYMNFYVRLWDERAVLLSGNGWLAFAIALSGGRHPLVVLLTAFIFSILVHSSLQLVAWYNISRDLAYALPFIVAIIAMTIYMATPLRRILAPPKSLGRIYFREERTV
ncbi:ABC transporter permease subunit [Thermogladius sp. 4427co]|uniref:ABC transporter permease subunit n=1 Tax=Thermogladius sp. 4427co TaxID=3450718 RepID=UPI003F7A1EB9